MTPEEFVNKYKPLAFYVNDYEEDKKDCISCIKSVEDEKKYPYRTISGACFKYGDLATEEEIKACDFGSAKRCKEELINNLREYNSMNDVNRHKHYDLIEEWARTGKQIQYKSGCGGWFNTSSPSWDVNTEYRFKPDVIRYKRFLVRTPNGDILVRVTQGSSSKSQQYRDDFVSWIDTEWQEVEV